MAESEIPVIANIMFGEMKLEPVKYSISERRRGWLRPPLFFIECEWSSLGPFKTRTEAESTLATPMRAGTSLTVIKWLVVPAFLVAVIGRLLGFW